MTKEIVIKPNYVFKDYFKVNLYMLIRKPFVIIFISFTILFIVISSLGYLISNNKENIFDSLKPFYAFIILFPSLIIFRIHGFTKKSLENPKLKEDIEICFAQNHFEETGQTFSVKYLWTEIFKIVEKKECFLIFLEKNVVKIIRKTDLKDNQYNELKELFNSIDIKKV